ncbi:hypothetical protein SCORR_v1c05030 [Spiroplasma corruscae]|uniref:Uncharacterized protein n=1 Tax=Spiroplasma corruscae TaxID=216934 RepID=A0A222EP32_9MOLU|nr:hypothetical protein [Spiroplasma corruscae]ASP28275.1 hypothetical protein SCORR_v1c05030 [Spiroplasma corruscae]
MNEKVYNIKKSNLGKISFLEGTSFISISAIGDDNKRFRGVLIVRTPEEAVKKFSSWAMDFAYSHISDRLTFHNSIVNYLIENWMDNGIKSFQKDMYEHFGFDEFRDMDPILFIKSEPEMVPLCLIHIAAKHTNGYFQVPVNGLEISIRYVKNVLAINFWEDQREKE